MGGEARQSAAKGRAIVGGRTFRRCATVTLVGSAGDSLAPRLDPRQELGKQNSTCFSDMYMLHASMRFNDPKVY